MESIVSLKEYTDGIGINRETSPAYQEIFRMSNLDSWLIVNLVDTVMDMDEIRLPKKEDPTLYDLLNQRHKASEEDTTSEK